MKNQDFIWDLGGTLLDNYELSTIAFMKAMKDHGLLATHALIYQALKVSTDEAIRKFAPSIPQFLQEYKEYEAEALENPILFPGVKAFLKSVVDAGGRNFLVSHRNRQVLEILEKTGIASYFEEVVTSDSGFPRKPNPASMLYLKDKYHMTDGWVIGDRPIDLEAGQAAGFRTYLFDSIENFEKTLEETD